MVDTRRDKVLLLNHTLLSISNSNVQSLSLSPLPSKRLPPSKRLELECPVPLPLAAAIKEANTHSGLSISNSNVESLSLSLPLPMWHGDMSGMDAVSSPPHTLRSSPAPSSSPSSGCASLAEDSGADGPLITLPSHPALSVGTAAPPLLLFRPPLHPPTPHPPCRPPGFSLDSGQTSWSFNLWEHPRFLRCHISSDTADVTVSVSISVAQDCPPPCPY